MLKISSKGVDDEGKHSIGVRVHGLYRPPQEYGTWASDQNEAIEIAMRHFHQDFPGLAGTVSRTEIIE